jgi:hypothetical protein
MLHHDFSSDSAPLTNGWNKNIFIRKSTPFDHAEHISGVMEIKPVDQSRKGPVAIAMP